VPIDEETRRAADDLVEALAPLDARAKAMFGGYCFYVDDKVVGLVCDGRVFVKRSARDDLLEGSADLAPAYPGAKDSWRLPVSYVETDPDGVRDIVEQVAAALPVRRKRS
jgi:TfoX/Sxy family transcriptional regulator of competence genes